MACAASAQPRSLLTTAVIIPPFIFGFMKHLLRLFLLFTLSLSARAQAPGWQLAVTATQSPVSGSFSTVQATAADASGNIYLAGSFQGTVAFGTTSLTSAGSSDGFVAKWSPVTNSFVWAYPFGGTDYDLTAALAVKGTAIYVAGSYLSAPASFGGLALTNSGSTDAFVVKLTDLGSTATFVWAQRAASTGADAATALAVNEANVYVAGYFYDAALGVGSSTLPNQGASDSFVAKLLDAGTSASFAWAQRTGGAGYERANALAVAGSSVYVAGYFDSQTVAIGPNTLTNASTAATSDVYVAKLTDAGSTSSFVWAQRAGGLGNESVSALAVAASNVYLAGTFTSATASFGLVTLTNAGSGTSSDMFIAKLADTGSTGMIQWAQGLGGSGQEIAHAVAVSGTKVYVAGDFSSAAVQVGPTLVANGSNNRSTYDALLVGLTDAGSSSQLDWGQRAGGGSSDHANALAVSRGQVYVAGSVVPTSSFGSITISAPVGYELSYLAAFPDQTALANQASAQVLPTSLAPNPAQTSTTLLVAAGSGASHLTVTLTDILGRVEQSWTSPLPSSGLRIDIPTTSLARGLHLLTVQAGATRTLHRLAVE